MNVALESLVPDPLAALPEGPSPLRQFAAFAGVGGSGALGFMALSSLAIGLDTGLPNWVMSTLCYGLMIGPVYLLHRRFTFPSEAPHRQALPRYVGVQVMALLLAFLFGFVAYRMIGLPTLWASLFVTVLTSGLNFMVLKIWAFAHHPHAEAAADAALATPAES